MESVGILIIARDTNRFFLLHRAKNPIVWSTLSGKMEKGESPMTTIKREIKEEIGIDPSEISGIKKLGTTKTKSQTHHVMIGYTDTEFKVPKLDKTENDSYGWYSESDLPFPMHPKWDEALKLIKPFLDLREALKKNINKFLN